MTRHYRVAATNGAGTGPYSNVESASTNGDPATAPKPPMLFLLSEVGRNQVTIAWDPPEDDGGAPVSGYEYEVARPCEDNPASNCGYTGLDIEETTGTSARITGLNPVGKGEWAPSL